ncbi:NUDIX hydrolase [Deinococcus arcticus]|uniref:NUDIX hydrolase n=2 Tax=Deinococcus arcticus TaxID=2136176 RepID=A0A2T3W3Q5_9DEIO|nr:NUDIX hydrolase [Deinococcus arcticus]
MYANVHLILERDGQLLLLLRQNTGYADGQYALVAGYVDEGQSSTAAAVTEAREEAGLDLCADDLDLVHITHLQDERGESRYGLFFRPRTWTGQPVNLEPQYCAGLHWFRPDDLPTTMIPYVRHALTLALQGVPYSEWGFSPPHRAPQDSGALQ